jgi:hypothetical protein
MDGFLADQSEYASVARRCIRRDLVHLRLLEKNEKWMRPALKARIRSNLKELELCNVLIDWTQALSSSKYKREMAALCHEWSNRRLLCSPRYRTRQRQQHEADEAPQCVY